MKTIFVTGGTGFIGQEVVNLLKSKYKLLVLTKKPLTNKKNITYVLGNILDKASLEKSLASSDIILHIAGKVKGNSKDLWKINYLGTKNLTDLVINQKFIFISSENVLFPKQGAYGQSKKKAESLVSNLKNHLILRPSAVYGKNETKNLGSIINICKSSSIIFLPGSGRGLMQPIFVKDLANLIKISIDKNLKGSHVLFGYSKISLNNFINLTCKILNKNILKIHIPLFILYPFVKLNELLPNPLISWSQILNLNSNRFYDIKKLIKEFRYTPLTIEQGLIQTLK